MQSILPLQDGSALRLTTAKYYTPSHKVIHEQGITPDIVVPMTDEEERDILIKRAPGGLETSTRKIANGSATRATRNSTAPWTCSRASRCLPSARRRPSPAAKSGKMAASMAKWWQQVGRASLRVRRLWQTHDLTPTIRRLAMTLLAFETSCDETSAAVVHDGRVLSNVVSSQIHLHAEYGGVVPELAAREHLRNLIPVTQAALREARRDGGRHSTAWRRRRGRVCPAR